MISSTTFDNISVEVLKEGWETQEMAARKGKKTATAKTPILSLCKTQTIATTTLYHEALKPITDMIEANKNKIAELQKQIDGLKTENKALILAVDTAQKVYDTKK